MRPTGERTVPGVASETYWFRRHEAAYRFARRLVRAPVVDAGSGEGYGTAQLARAGTTVGVDLDRASVAHAAARYAVPFAVGDLCRMPVRRAGSIVALQVLEHLWCPEAFLDACAEALQGEPLILSTPNRDTFPAGNPSHVHEYDAGELGGLLRPRFAQVRLFGLRHRAPLRALDRALGGSIQRRLIERGWEDQPLWAHAILRTVRARDFAIDERLEGCLDLVAVCGSPATACR